MVIDKPVILMYTNLASGREISIIQAGKVRGGSATTAIAVMKRRIFYPSSHASQSEGLPGVLQHIPWANEGRRLNSKFEIANLKFIWRLADRFSKLLSRARLNADFLL